MGRTIWDDVFGEDSLELPSTGFMEKVKQTVMKEAINEENFRFSTRKKRTSSAKVPIPHSKKQGVNCIP